MNELWMYVQITTIQETQLKKKKEEELLQLEPDLTIYTSHR